MIVVQVTCDECGTLSESTLWRSISRLRAELRRIGWAKKNNHDLCPKCSATDLPPAKAE